MGWGDGGERRCNHRLNQNKSSWKSLAFLIPRLPSPASSSSFKRTSILVKSSREKRSQAESSRSFPEHISGDQERQTEHELTG